MWSTCSCFVFILFLNVFQQTSQKTLLSLRQNDRSQYDRMRRAAGDPIVFPDTTPKRRPAPALTIKDRIKVPASVEEPKCPDNEPFCENHDNYPMDLIKDLLKKQPKVLLDQFYTDHLPTPELIDKFASDTDTPICGSHTTLVFPKVGFTTEGSYEYIINDDNQYKQGVRTEKCINHGECNIPGDLPNGYSSHCIQKKITRAMVVLNRNASEVAGFVTKPFEFPSCCSCMISTSGLDRFGFSHNNNAHSPGGSFSLRSGLPPSTNMTTTLKPTSKPFTKAPSPKPTSSKPTSQKMMASKPTSPSTASTTSAMPTTSQAASNDTKKV